MFRWLTRSTWLRSWLPIGRTPLPALLRVLDPWGRPANEVHFHGRWLPSGRHVRGTQRGAGGLCLIPWAIGERRLSVRLTTENVATEVTVDAWEASSGEVRLVRLAAATSTRGAPSEAPSP